MNHFIKYYLCLPLIILLSCSPIPLRGTRITEPYIHASICNKTLGICFNNFSSFQSLDTTRQFFSGGILSQSTYDSIPMSIKASVQSISCFSNVSIIEKTMAIDTTIEITSFAGLTRQFDIHHPETFCDFMTVFDSIEVAHHGTKTGLTPSLNVTLYGTFIIWDVGNRQIVSLGRLYAGAGSNPGYTTGGMMMNGHSSTVFIPNEDYDSDLPYSVRLSQVLDSLSDRVARNVLKDSPFMVKKSN